MFIEDEDGVLVENEEDLKAFCEMAGWTSVKEFEEEHRVSKEELYGKKFVTVRGSLSFV